MAINYYHQLAAWCRLEGDADCAATFGALAERLAAEVNAKLWDEALGWYGNLYPDGTLHTVLSYRTLEALRTFGPERQAPAVPVVRRERMLERIAEGELLAPYGLWSISRSDTAHWSREDCDWGGGGQYVGQTGRLAEMLFTVGQR